MGQQTNLMIRSLMAALMVIAPVQQTFAQSSTPHRGPSNVAPRPSVDRNKPYEGFKGPDGGAVIGEGSVDGQGRTRVSSSILDSSGQLKTHKGVIESSGNVTWENGQVSERAVESRNRSQSVVEQLTEPQARLTPTSVPTLARNQVLEGVSGPHLGSVIGTGRLDSQGRQMVSTYSKGPSGEVVLRGVIQADGSVLWETGQVSTRRVSPDYNPEQRPSRLRRILGWGSGDTASARQQLKGITSGQIDPLAQDRNLLTLPDAGSKKDPLTKRLAGGAANIGVGAGTFYVALGLAAAFSLMVDYPDDPLAYDSYLESLSDPVGWLSLFSFILVAGSFYKTFSKKINPNGTFLRGGLVFGGGLIAGMMVSTGIQKFAGDPDVKACLGFTAYRANGSWTRDYKACDAAYAKWAGDAQGSSELSDFTLSMIPLSANLLIGGSIYLGGVQALNYGLSSKLGTAMINKSRLVQILRSIPLSRSPGRFGGPIGLTTSVLHGLAFLGAFQIADSAFGVEKLWNQNLTTDGNWLASAIQKRDVFGTNLAKAESNLLEEWKTIKATGWKNPDLWDKVCVDTNRPYQIIYNCEEPNRLSFDGVIDRYAKLQSGWRAIQLEETKQAHDAWAKKGSAYQKLFKETEEFYTNTIAAIETDPNSVTPASLKLSGRTFLMPFESNFDGTWVNVYTPKLNDYLLTSMACGPEIEGYSAQGGIWESTRQWLKWASGNNPPKAMFDDSSGFKVEFHSPRVTKPLKGTTDSICERQVSRYYITTFPAVDENRKRHQGLISYIKENLRESVLSKKDGNRFSIWWQDYVQPQVEMVNAKLQKEYADLLNGNFKKSVTRDEIYSGWCSASPVDGTGLEAHMRRLSFGGETCAPEALHRLNYGIFRSLQDEMRLYISMAIDIQASNQNPEPSGLVAKGREILSLLEEMGRYVTTTDLNARKQINARMEKLLEEEIAAAESKADQVEQESGERPEVKARPRLEGFQDINYRGADAIAGLFNIISTNTTPDVDDKDGVKLARALKLHDKMQSVLAEYATYYSILTRFEGKE